MSFILPAIGDLCLHDARFRFWQRASRYAPKATKERFVNAWRSYIASVILQAERRGSAYICGIEEYMASRRDNIGSDPSFALLEMSLELDVPHEVMQHPFIVSLNRDTTDMIVLANVSLLHSFYNYSFTLWYSCRTCALT